MNLNLCLQSSTWRGRLEVGKRVTFCSFFQSLATTYQTVRSQDGQGILSNKVRLSLKQLVEIGIEFYQKRKPRYLSASFFIKIPNMMKCTLKLRIKTFISEFFGKQVSKSTAHNYLQEFGFASRVAHGKSGGFQLDNEKLVQLAFQWLKSTSIRCTRSSLCSIDFTYTSHRTDRRVSFSLRGAPQPQLDISISRFTNCIVTCIWADGVRRTPSLLFTYNQAFRLDRPPTERRDAQLVHYEKCLKKYDVSPQRVIYIGSMTGESRCYVAESPLLIRQFF